MTGFKGALVALAGDLSLTILLRRLRSVSDASSFEIPNTNGIGQLFSVDFMALPKSNEAGELKEKSEEESPSSLKFLVLEVGEFASL